MSAHLKNKLLRSELFKQPAGIDQADEIIVDDVMKVAEEVAAKATATAATAEVIDTADHHEDDESSGYDSCGGTSSESPTDEDYMAEDFDPFDIKETENDLQCDPKGVEKFDDFIIQVVLSDSDDEPPMKGSVLTSAEEATHASCSDIKIRTAWLTARNAYSQRLARKGEEKKQARSRMNVIRKKAARERHMLQLQMLQGADELVARSNVEASFKRSKFDPFHYEAVVAEVLERNKIREEEEMAEFAHGSNIPTEVQAAFTVESEARAILRDPTLALPSAEDKEDIDFAAVVDEAMEITRCRICTKRVASNVCNVCRIDGFCDVCFKANRTQIMQLYRYLKFCDLCKKSHHTSCGDTVKSGRSRCHVCSTSEHKHENPKYAFKRAPWRNKISDDYLNKDAADSSRPKPKDYWADDRVGATTGRWSTKYTQDSSSFQSDARGSDDPIDSSSNPWLILDNMPSASRVITEKARPPLKFPVPDRMTDRTANPQ